MTPKYDILVAGEINPDLILSSPDLDPKFEQQEILVENAELTIGSSSAIFACGAARLGLKVAFIGIVGRDLFGRFMLDSLQDREVDTSHVIIDPEQKTGISVILNRAGARAILTHNGAIDALNAEQIPANLLGEARHLHVGSYFLQTNLRPGLFGLFTRARSQGLTTSLDPNWDPTEKWSGIHQLLQVTDVFLPNEAEARAITGTTTVQAAVEGLAKQVGTVAVKMGSEGALARRGDVTLRTGGIQVEVADTVGAGDSFDAGFVYGFLENWDLEVCLKLGVVCGALSTQKHGGTAAQPSLDEALQAVRNL